MHISQNPLPLIIQYHLCCPACFMLRPEFTTDERDNSRLSFSTRCPQWISFHIQSSLSANEAYQEQLSQLVMLVSCVQANQVPVHVLCLVLIKPICSVFLRNCVLKDISKMRSLRKNCQSMYQSSAYCDTHTHIHIHTDICIIICIIL